MDDEAKQRRKRNIIIVVIVLCALSVLGGHTAATTSEPKHDVCTEAQTDSTNPFVSDSAANEEIRQCWISVTP